MTIRAKRLIQEKIVYYVKTNENGAVDDDRYVYGRRRWKSQPDYLVNRFEFIMWSLIPKYILTEIFRIERNEQ